MTHTLRLFYLLAFLSISFSNACKNDEDCSLNGICSRWKKTCRCDPGWIGSDCGRLDLAPATRYTGYNHTYEPPSREDFGIWPNASWGGRIVQDRDNKQLFHLFTVQFSHGCGLKGWRPHSYIIRAESHSGPQGPYKYAQDVSKNFAHNPDIVWSQADKKYLLYSIGVEYDKNFTKCESISYTKWPNNISVSAADDIHGPWSPFKMIIDSDRPAGIHATNPSAFPLWTRNSPTSEIVLGIKDYSIFTAKSWNGDYKLKYQAHGTSQSKRIQNGPRIHSYGTTSEGTGTL
ncbi:hypothetical protein FPRO04_12947 [Fusarium proliferatum]|nr:hypothetical protein FPRO04_12947 [Fusarium proliferatum]